MAATSSKAAQEITRAYHDFDARMSQRGIWLRRLRNVIAGLKLLFYLIFAFNCCFILKSARILKGFDENINTLYICKVLSYMVARRFGLMSLQPLEVAALFDLRTFQHWTFRPTFHPWFGPRQITTFLTMYIFTWSFLCIITGDFVSREFVTRRIRTQYTNSLVNSNQIYPENLYPTYNFYFNKLHTMCKLYRSLFPYLMFSAIEINLRFVYMFMYILK